MPNSQTLPYGRRLSDLWLDGIEGELLPAEWKLLEAAARGNWCELGDELPNIGTEHNRLRAQLLRFIILGGDEDHALHEHGVQIRGAYIECSDGVLDLKGSFLPENITLRESLIKGVVVFEDAEAQSVNLDGCHCTGVEADRLDCAGSFSMRSRFQADGNVSLEGAKIGGNLDLDRSRLRGAPFALSANELECDGDVNLSTGCVITGEVSLTGATIDGNLNCTNARFLNEPRALTLQSAQINGSLLLDLGFLAIGSVSLAATNVEAHLICSGGTFSDKNTSLHAARLKVGGNVNLGEDCRTAGPVSFQGAQIGGDLTFAGGAFEGQPAVNLRNATLEGMMVWRGVAHARGELNLAGMACRTLNMDWQSWNKPAHVRLDQFSYKGFSELPAGCDADFWRRWLECQPDKHLNEKFRPNPYSQLANVLQSMGHEQEAVSVRVEQRRRQARFTRLFEPVAKHNALSRKLIVFWNFWTGLLVDYGYRPGKAILFLAALIAFGAVIFYTASVHGIMTPTHPLIYKEAGKSIPADCARNWIYPPKSLRRECEASMPSEYSTFSALVYSADVALPIVNFRMEDDWSPRLADWKTGAVPPIGNNPPWGWGWWVRTWEWIQIGLGWMLSLLFVSAVGGIIRR